MSCQAVESARARALREALGPYAVGAASDLRARIGSQHRAAGACSITPKVCSRQKIEVESDDDLDFFDQDPTDQAHSCTQLEPPNPVQPCSCKAATERPVRPLSQEASRERRVVQRLTEMQKGAWSVQQPGSHVCSLQFLHGGHFVAAEMYLTCGFLQLLSTPAHGLAGCQAMATCQPLGF